MIPTLNYVPLTSKRKLARDRRIQMIVQVIICTPCFIAISLGAGFPWWCGFIASALFMWLSYWLTYKKNLDVLYIGPGTTKEMIARLPEE